MKFNVKITTGGAGLWSRAKKEVQCTKLNLRIFACDLNVYFTKGSWNIKKDGLIYTDVLFLQTLRSELKAVGFTNVNNVDYSEQGMQGDDFVSLDVDEKFIKNWNALNGK